MIKRLKKHRRDEEVEAKVAVVNAVIATQEGPHATLVPGVTDEDPNTGRRIEKKRKK